MSELSIRLATVSDINTLVEMRCDFKFEDDATGAAVARPRYEADCRMFLESAVAGIGWQVWVAELHGRIVSHVFVALIDKVPSPLAENTKISYLTNVYTLPAYRGRGIGARLVKRTQQSTRAAGVELMLVWPSQESVAFYKRLGFDAPEELMVWSAGK